MYNIEIKEKNDFNTIIVPMYSDLLEATDKEINEKLQRVILKKKFKGILGQVEISELGEKEIIFVGLGESSEITKEKVRRTFGILDKNINEENILLDLSRTIDNNKIKLNELVKSLAEGLTLADYKFDKYLNKKTKKNVDMAIYLGEKQNIYDDSIKEELEETLNLSRITHEVRSLINEPSNVIYPQTLADKAIEAGNEYGFEVDVLDELDIKILKMDAFLSVGKGSNKKPRFIIMRYLADKENDKTIGLVGKGLTYDSGGYSIKATDAMLSMKADMGGAAVVIGVMSALAKNNVKSNVISVIPACENVISEHSYKPGDIINSMAGKTIEVVNVDAEGRLTIVDGVTYIINKESVSEIIDVATLTASVSVALGKDVAASMSNNEDFYKELEEAIKITDEKIWRMPSYEDYKKLYKSDIADLKNYGSPYGKVMSAGMFIGEFVEDKPWIHLDIAGPSFIDSDMEYCPKGGTGMSLRTIYELIKARTK